MELINSQNFKVRKNSIWFLLHFQRGYSLIDIKFIDSLTKKSLISPVFSLNCKPIFCLYNQTSIQKLRKYQICPQCGNQIQFDEIYADIVLEQIVLFLKNNKLQNATIRLKDDRWSILQALQLGQFDIKYNALKNNILTSKYLKFENNLWQFENDLLLNNHVIRKNLHFSDRYYFEEDPIYLVKNNKVFFFDMIAEQLKQINFIDGNGQNLKFQNIYLNKRLFVGQLHNNKICYSYLIHFRLKQNTFKVIYIDISVNKSIIFLHDWDLYLISSSICKYKNFMYNTSQLQTITLQPQNQILIWDKSYIQMKFLQNFCTLCLKNKQIQLQFEPTFNSNSMSFSLVYDFLVFFHHNSKKHVGLNLKNYSIIKLSFEFSVPKSNIIFSDFIGRYLDQQETLKQFFLIL